MLNLRKSLAVGTLLITLTGGATTLTAAGAEAAPAVAAAPAHVSGAYQVFGIFDSFLTCYWAESVLLATTRVTDTSCNRTNGKWYLVGYNPDV
jgi:hypothetical protein